MHQRNKDKSLRLLITLALLCAIGIILGKFLAFNVTEFMRFSLENLPIFLASIVFGPLAGACVGIVEDIIGCMLAGYVLNPLITLGAALNGLVAGFIYKLLGKLNEPLKISLSVFPAHLIGSVMTKTLGLALYYSLPFSLTLWWRTLNYLIVGTVEVIVLCYLLKSKLLLSNIQKIKSKDIHSENSEKSNYNQESLDIASDKEAETDEL